MKPIFDRWRAFILSEQEIRGASGRAPRKKIRAPSPFGAVIDRMGPPKDLSDLDVSDMDSFLRYANAVRPHKDLKGMFEVDLAILQGQKGKREVVILDKKTSSAFVRFVEEYTLKSAPTWGPLSLSGRAPHLDQRGSKTTRSKTSQHMKGKAIDLRSPFPSKDLDNHIAWKSAVLSIAYEHGFRAFGFGENVVHIDTRSRPGFWVYADGKTSPSYNFRRFQHLIPWGNEYFPRLVRKGMVRHLKCFLDSDSRRNRCAKKRSRLAKKRRQP